jgi:putative transport protein
VVVRLIRQEFEIVPRGSMTFEAGDVVRVVGEREEVDAFAKAAGVKNEKANETNFLPFILGLIFGLILGLIPVSLPVLHGAPITLGSAGGALLAGLIISRQKRIGKMEMHVPIAALNIIRELGLMFFLSGAGLVAGSQFVGVFQEYGISVLFAGALITAITCFSGAVMLVLLRLDILSIMAGVSAGMTQASALAVTRKLAKTELPTLAYVNIYPFAMILKIIFVQVLVSILAIFY